MVVASCTGHHSLGGRGLAPVLRWDMRPEKPACPVSPVLRNTSTCSLTHTTPWRSSLIPSTTQLTRTTKIPPVFSISEGTGQFSSSWHFVWNQLRSCSDKHWSWQEGNSNLSPLAGSLPPDHTGMYWKPQPREPEYTHLTKDSDPFKTVL